MTLQPCGTPAAYLRHWRRGEDPCTPCKEAHRAHNKENARKVRASSRNLPPCTVCGGPRKPRRGVHGWCNACTLRWQYAGKPDSGPPPPPTPEETHARRVAASRINGKKGGDVSQQQREIDRAARAGGWHINTSPQTAVRACEVVRFYALAADVDELLDALGLTEVALERVA